jgi:hypothetical protein
MLEFHMISDKKLKENYTSIIPKDDESEINLYQ